MEFFNLAEDVQMINNYSAILMLLAVIFLVKFVWNLWKSDKCYKALPSNYSFAYEIIFEYLANKGEKHLTNVLFQKLDAVAKLFEKEGMVQTWIFRRVLIIFGEEATKTFVTNEACIGKPQEYETLKEGLGDGLLTSSEAIWKKERKLLNPAFGERILKTMVPTFNENAAILVKKIAEVVDKPHADLTPYLLHCTYYNLFGTIFNYDLKYRNNEMTVKKLYEKIEQCIDYAATRWYFPAVIAKLLTFCTPSGWKNRKVLREANKVGEKLVSDIKESITPCEKKDGFFHYHKSLAQILVEHHYNDPSFTLYHLQSHVYTFAIGGTETIVYTLVWCLYLLGLHKDLQQKAYEEVLSVGGELITYDDICQFKYLECFIKETLRLYPTIPVIARYLKEDVQCGKYNVPKDTTLVFVLYRLHRNPNIYKDPEKFDPDRFLFENAGKRKWAHLPFSEGIRNCIGKKFAMMEMKIVLAYMLRNYEITSLDKREDLDLSWKLVLKPLTPLRMRLTLREKQTGVLPNAGE